MPAERVGRNIRDRRPPHFTLFSKATRRSSTVSCSAEELSRAFYREMVVQRLGIKDPKLLARLAR